MLRQQLQAIDDGIKKLERQREKTMRSLQSRCKHPDIVEGEYVSGCFSTQPPFRVCKSCGLAEEGWGCGYWKLNTKEDVPSMKRDTAYKYVLNFCSQEDMNERRFKR